LRPGEILVLTRHLQLNDIISLLVGLWAVSVARKATTDKFSYGVSDAPGPLDDVASAKAPADMTGRSGSALRF
jgi:hypothetical protein